MPVCTRKSCEKAFASDNNGSEACRFHPGAAVFHEGLKGWSCCSKRVVDFEGFLAIPGCATGPHTDIKPDPLDIKKTQPVKAESPTPDSKDSTGSETYSMVEVKDALPTGPTPKVLSDSEKKKIKEEEEASELQKEDDTSIAVSVGTACKRRGCGYKFVSDELSRKDGLESSCQFHPGAPVFHEGSKGWSCCKRKVLEFDEFLKIKGCKASRHIFVEKTQANQSLSKEQVICRHDWYQSPTHVILSIFAKKVDKTSTFDFKPYQENKEFQKTLFLYQTIEPDNCKFEILSSKVEITLKKGNGIAWAALEKTENISSWTTFGTPGDSPLTARN